jgi:hypothetical protein
VQRGFDRKHIIRMILSSRVYQLSSQPTASNADDDRYFSRAVIRLLPAELLLDAIGRATGVAERFPDQPPGTTAVALPDGEYKHPFLEAFGRPARASACECERTDDTNLVQALELVGGRSLHEKLRSDAGRAAQLAASSHSDEEIVEELFLATLTRSPTAEERALLTSRLAEQKADRRRAVEDLLWLLINHGEFLFRR